MTACFTGAVLVFEKELQQAFNQDRYFVKPSGTLLPPEQLISSVKQKAPGAKVSGIKIYADPERTVEIGLSLSKEGNAGKPSAEKSFEANKRDKNQQAGKQRAPEGSGRATHTAFVNPYNGQVIELYSYRNTFFFTMFSLHRWLLGGENSIGKVITGVSTLIFLFILITGIILWWPKNRRILLHRLKIKTSGSWKRLNHDLHIVLGFYSAIFLFIFAFTALAWSFKWFNQGIYTVTGSSMKTPEPPHSVYRANKKPIGYNVAYSVAAKSITDVEYYSFRQPNDSTGVFTVNVLPAGAHETASDNYYIDQYSGNVIGSLKFADKNLGQRIRSTFKPVHVGSIFGITSKIIAFLVCILGVTFPVTGVIMWLNRIKKRKERKQGAFVKDRDVVVAAGVDDEDEED